MTSTKGQPAARPIARRIATLALLVLGGVAFARLPLDYYPRRSFPELAVSLNLGGESDPAEVTREWVAPLESAARSLGDVRGMASEVRADGADLTVRFAPGTDPERKAARLDSALARLRARLPRGAGLRVNPATEDDADFLAIVWLGGVSDDAQARAAVEAIRAVPGVRAVELLGGTTEELRFELSPGLPDPWGLAGTALGEIRRALRVSALGWSREGGRRRAVRLPGVDPEGAALAALPVPVGGTAVPLGSIATLRIRRQAPPSAVRLRGRPARALYVWRGHDAPLLAVDRALRQRLAELAEDREVVPPRGAPLLTSPLTQPPPAQGGGTRPPAAHRLSTPSGLRGEVGWSRADPLRDLVWRLALAGLLGTVAAAAVGGRRAGPWGALSWGLALPAIVAAAAHAFLLVGVALDATTLVALGLAAAGLLPLAALRLTGRAGYWTAAWSLVAAAATVPLAVALASAELGPLLAEPARALLLAVVAGTGAIAILPAPPPDRIRAEKSARGLRVARAALRDPGTFLLAATTLACLSLTLYGGALVPRPGDLEPDQGNLTLFLRLPPGATLEETVARAARAEAFLAQAPEVWRFWTYALPGRARVVAELRPDARSPGRQALLALRLRYEAAGLGAVEILSGRRTSTSGRGFLEDLEDHARTDDEARSYRVVLSGANLGAVRAGYDRLLQRLETLQVRPYWLTAGWGDPAVHLILRPRRGYGLRWVPRTGDWLREAPEEAGPQDQTEPVRRPDATPELAALAERLRQESGAPTAVALPAAAARGDDRAVRSVVVVPAGTPEDPDRAIPQLADLLGRPLLLGGRRVLPATLLQPIEEILYPRVARQSGRFVVPVEIQFPHEHEAVRREWRQKVDRSLRQLSLPPGCDLERPVLGLLFLTGDRLRILALALAIPLLLFVVAACRLGSLGRALATLVPAALGLAAALPLVGMSRGQVDELTVFALAAGLALALAVVSELATVPLGLAAPGAAGGLYRDLRRQLGWLAPGAPLAALVLAAPTLGADAVSHPWAVPLRAAALAAGTALASAGLLVPALLLAGDRWRRRDPAAIHRRRQPPAWSEPGEPLLVARSLTKVYGGRFQALAGIDFTLTPGIVGLLGPNGAGKTTLLRLLTGLLEPTRGSVRYRGVPVTAENLAAYRRRIGFLPQELNAYPGFTAEEFLDHWAEERGMTDPRERRSEIERLLAAVDLSAHAGRKVRDFSGGMRQRVGIALALLGSPPILIVDEPTTGLDIESRNRFRQILLEQAARRIVVFSTHIASDVDAAARRLLLLHQGRLRFDGTPEALAALARGRVFHTLVTDAELPAFGERYRLTSRVRVLEGIEVRGIARPGEILPGEAVEPNLEEAYLAEIDRAEPYVRTG
jgi:ABC-2 type transport system ATP-binding protein